jgi:SAM-dependent methyltransferase
MSGLALSAIGTELLDDPAADPAAVAVSLQSIARANRWMGGHAAVRFGLGRLLPRGLRSAILLDVGTGLGDVPAMARTWAARRSLALRTVGLERAPSAARLARAPALPLVLGCGSALPFPDRAVDVTLVSQVAHHLTARACVTLFRECARVSRRGLLVSDLARSRAARLGFAVAGRMLGFDRHTLHDGAVSLRRGFRPRELASLLADAGLPARVYRRPGARLVALWSAG